MDTRNKLLCLLGLAGSLLIIGSGVLYGLGWPHYAEHLAEGEIGANVAGAIRVGWYWSAAAFVGFGIIALTESVTGLRGGSVRRPVVGVISALFGLFGVVAVFAHGAGPHTFGFVACGLFVGALWFVRPAGPL